MGPNVEPSFPELSRRESVTQLTAAVFTGSVLFIVHIIQQGTRDTETKERIVASPYGLGPAKKVV